MKKIVKLSITVAAVAGVGYLAYKGLKRLVDKSDLCCCDRASNDEKCDCCECETNACECGCECECHGDPAEAPAEEEAAVEVPVPEVEEKPAEEPVEAPKAE